MWPISQRFCFLLVVRVPQSHEQQPFLTFFRLVLLLFFLIDFWASNRSICIGDKGSFIYCSTGFSISFISIEVSKGSSISETSKLSFNSLDDFDSSVTSAICSIWSMILIWLSLALKFIDMSGSFYIFSSISSCDPCYEFVSAIKTGMFTSFMVFFIIR